MLTILSNWKLKLIAALLLALVVYGFYKNYQIRSLVEEVKDAKAETVKAKIEGFSHGWKGRMRDEEDINITRFDDANWLF